MKELEYQQVLDEGEKFNQMDSWWICHLETQDQLQLGEKGSSSSHWCASSKILSERAHWDPASQAYMENCICADKLSMGAALEGPSGYSPPEDNDIPL